MPDDSYLDDRYFIDAQVYNCPFCNRRHVKYTLFERARFDWTFDKPCHVYFVRCDSCPKESMHLSYKDMPLTDWGNYYTFKNGDGIDVTKDLDDSFFYSVPTSFFVLDDRIPRVLRKLITEAEGSLKSNYLTARLRAHAKLYTSWRKSTMLLLIRTRNRSSLLKGFFLTLTRCTSTRYSQFNS